jgi:putative DNA primase/helicase
MIKTPPDTIMDRSVVINLRRRTRHERVHKIPVSLFDDQVDIRRKLARWSLDNIDDLRHSQPVLPEIDNDRAEDNWHSLFAIAQALGGDWPEVVVATMKILEGAKPDDEDIGAMLLTDIQSVFSDWKHDNIFSEDLVAALVDMESRPWCEWRRGQPMTKNSLARLLKPYAIRSADVRVGLAHKKGYHCKDFHDAFDRYLVDFGVQNVTTRQPSAGVASEGHVTENANVTKRDETRQRDTNATLKPSNGAGCHVVTVEMPKEDF